MTREQIVREIDFVDSVMQSHFNDYGEETHRALQEAIEFVKQEPKPMEKFESAKDHIFNLAGDYKCWDNRLTQEEALELCHILEQEPCKDCVIELAPILEEYENLIRINPTSQQIDEWCVKTMRKILCDYYAEKILDESITESEG